MVIREDARLTPEWLAAIHEIDEHLATRDDCARMALFIVADDGGIRIIATTPSGRRAERTVATPASLRAIMIGLVTSIPNEPPPAKSADRDSSREVRPLEIPPEDPTLASWSKQSRARSAPRLVGEITAGVRVGMPTRVLATELGARGDVFVDDWFLMAGVRYAPLGFSLRHQDLRGYTYDEVALELGVGRRFRAGAALIDIALASAMVIMSESAELPLDIAAGTRSEARGDLALRALFGASRFKSSITLDFEIAPFAIQAPLVADEAIPSLPTWTIGVGIGVAGDLL